VTGPAAPTEAPLAVIVAVSGRRTDGTTVPGATVRRAVMTGWRAVMIVHVDMTAAPVVGRVAPRAAADNAGIATVRHAVIGTRLTNRVSPDGVTVVPAPPRPDVMAASAAIAAEIGRTVEVIDQTGATEASRSVLVKDVGGRVTTAAGCGGMTLPGRTVETVPAPLVSVPGAVVTHRRRNAVAPATVSDSRDRAV